MRRVPLALSVLVAAALLVPAAALSAQVRAEYGVMVPLRDGVRLASDVWRPEAPGRYPVLLTRTPYQRTGHRLHEWARYFAARGYAVVVQDTRGRGDSEGHFEFFAGDGKDGYDVIEWLAQQPWSNGRVGMFGLSYLGTVQWLAAKERPPHLACIAPTAPGGRWFDELPYLGGAFAFQWAVGWTNGMMGRIQQNQNLAGTDWDRVLAHRPLISVDSALGRVNPIYRSWLEHPVAGPFWARMELAAQDFAAIDIPTLTTTGWYDTDQPGSMFYWRGVMAHAKDPSQHFLMIGPWEHEQTFQRATTKVGLLEFSPESVVDNKAIHAAFFDWCLKQSAPRFQAPRAQVYVTGANAWRSFEQYPPVAATPTKLYLTSGGRANTRRGDGLLVPGQPVDSPPDRFTYDPRTPVPASMADQAIDRQALQDRDDVLVYSTEALTRPLEIIGDVMVELRAATDARDTDFTAILSDVGPDGRAIQLGSRIGIRRGRYRRGYTKEELLTPGSVETFPIELFDIAHQFKAGHRVRLEISSSAAPYYNPNQNTGNPVATDTVWKVARQVIHHDRARPSSITLPVMPRGADDAGLHTAAPAGTDTLVDVGGRRLHAKVFGRGAPTVVLLSALGATQDYWDSVRPALAAQATVLTYDRAGVGRSEVGALPAHALQSARDLRVLLDSLRVPKPYLVVGHSYGGNIARLFASMYPADIAGMVLEETQHEDNLDEMRKLLTGTDLETFDRVLAPGFAAPANPRTERDYRSATRDQLRQATPLPHVPFVVLTVAGRAREMQSMFSADATNRLVTMDVALMERLAASVPGGRHILVEGSGHNLHIDRPDALLGHVLSMVAVVKRR